MFETILNHIFHPKNIYSKIRRLHHKKKEANIRLSKLVAYVRVHGLKAFVSKTIDIMKGKNDYVYQSPLLTEKVKRDLNGFQKTPLISIIMPVYNVDPKWLDQAIKSVEHQWYPHWELCIADDCSTNQETIDYLSEIDHQQIKRIRLKENRHISAASNETIKLASGDYVAFLDNDDELTVDALYEIVKRINETPDEVDILYSDEDKIEPDGTFSTPHFKPDYSSDMLMSQNYITHLTVIKREIVNAVGGFEIGLEGSQDYDLILKATEQTQKIQHIQKVLYHWRKIPGSTALKSNSKNYAYIAGKKALENTLKRRDLQGEVLFTNNPGTYRIKYTLQDRPLISIIIPFKDKPGLLKKCIYSIIKKTSYQNFEIIGISNNSIKAKTNKEIKRLSRLDNRIHFYEHNIPFNYSMINNHAVSHFAHGEHLILLNNDIEIISNDWIESMLEFSQRENVGAVGVMLLYPNRKIQHAGIILSLKKITFNSFNGLHECASGYFNRPHVVQNLSAVTGACLMVKKTLYQQIGGFDEEAFKISYNDVDFCLRLREKGYLNVYTPYAKAISATRWVATSDRRHYQLFFSHFLKPSQEKEKKVKKQLEIEQNNFKKKYHHLLQKGDPYYNPNLSLTASDFRLKDKQTLV